MENGVFTIGIGGAAGDGVKKAGIKISDYLRNLGYEVYISFSYPSLIRGGHNFARLSFSREKVWNDHSKLDALVCSNQESVELHREELSENAKVITDLALSAIPENPKMIFDRLEFPLASGEASKELVDGNTAFAKGLMAAGLDFYIAYPMTPATSILHFLAANQKQGGLKVIQPENEISAINMALGMVYAGKRAALGSAGGGFALMQEAMSFAGIAELPIVVAVSQRQAPATGVPTHSSQSDLRFALHAGHGEFPKIVLAPGCAEEAYLAGARALNLAWKYQTPVIVLLDKILSEHMMTAPLNAPVTVEKGKLAENANENYSRYQFTEDGISPMAFPGAPGATVKVTSYEHDERGITTDISADVKKMMEKRLAKINSIKNEMESAEPVKIYGDAGSENTIVFWGSTKSAVLEASKYFQKPAKLVQAVWMEPFPADAVRRELEGKNVIIVEGNQTGQLAGLVREKTGIEIKNKILKYDSDPFDPVELAREINQIFAN